MPASAAAPTLPKLWALNARTPPPAYTQVRGLAQYVQQRQQAGGAKLRYEAAQVTAVRPVGMGDRACVDLCRCGVVMLRCAGLRCKSGLWVIQSSSSSS